MRAVLPSRELSKASISKSSHRRVKNGSLFCAGIFPVCETPECLPISRPANALFLPSREVKRYLSKPFFSRPIKTPAAEAFQRRKLDRERIVVEKETQDSESPSSYTLRKLHDREVLLTGHHLY
jgi:hypothetical protein